MKTFRVWFVSTGEVFEMQAKTLKGAKGILRRNMRHVDVEQGIWVDLSVEQYPVGVE